MGRLNHRCCVIPLPDDQVSFQVDGSERLRWHFGSSCPRPYLYPLIGPSGSSLIRMGHPGAPDHDHHRGIWFAHHDVAGNSFWSDSGPGQIRQLEWLCYEDGDTEGRMAVTLGWFDGYDPQPLLKQSLIVAIRPQAADEVTVEIQATFTPTAPVLVLGKTNFGFLGVRVAKSISEYFGGGVLTNSLGATGESAVFGQAARWVDYSGTVGTPHEPVAEGLTYCDHPSNSEQPPSWHVREDGWMLASLCMQGPHAVFQQTPLQLRYLLHAHSGAVQTDRANEIANAFAESASMKVNKSGRKHTAYEIERIVQ